MVHSAGLLGGSSCVSHGYQKLCFFVLYCIVCIIALQASNKKKKEQEKHQIVIDKLKEEKRKQTENHKMIMVRVSS